MLFVLSSLPYTFPDLDTYPPFFSTECFQPSVVRVPELISAPFRPDLHRKTGRARDVISAPEVAAELHGPTGA